MRERVSRASGEFEFESAAGDGPTRSGSPSPSGNQCGATGLSPKFAAIVTRLASESAFILRIT
jgi:hypothetical protein